MSMKNLCVALLATMTLLTGTARADDASEGYRLRQGDIVLVSVWREATLEKETRVLPDGSITFPLAGRIVVAGLPTPEVERLVAAKLKKYIPDPVVSVTVVGIEGSKVFVLGKVVRPGPVALTGPTTVLQALSQAGGLDKFADGDAIRIIRQGKNGQEIINVRYGDFVSGKDLSKNVDLKAGDTILVP